VNGVQGNGWTFVLLVQLIAITVIDCKWQIIPNFLNASLMLTGLAHVYDGFWQTILYSAVASIVVMLVLWALKIAYSKMRKQEGLGWGDVKFLGAATTWIGLAGLPWVVLISAISGLAFAVTSNVLGRSLGLKHRLAFGPHLALGLFFAWVFRDTLTSSV
jgi:leader peptidase (prepilin peptidase) / N-methyltransferase